MPKSKNVGKGFAGRLQESMDNRGIPTRTKLARLLTEKGYPITDEALGAYFAGRTMPRSEVLIGLKSVLGISIDWLLTGEHPESPDLARIQKIVDNARLVKVTKEQELDLDSQRILSIMSSMNKAERARLADLLETMRSGK